MEIKPYPDLNSRGDIPKILNERGLTGKGVQVGAKVGRYSQMILNKWEGEKLYSIDPWKCNKDQDKKYPHHSFINQEHMDNVYENAKKNLNPFGDRSKILRMSSLEAVPIFEDSQLDFIHIDANHQYEEVKKDLNAWWPKLKEGALFSGHDFFDGETKTGFNGVKSAVKDFAEKKHLVVYYTTQKEVYNSWMIFK